MFSIIMPMDSNRFEQFSVTKRVYDDMPQVKEFIIPTRQYTQVAQFLKDSGLAKDVRLISYNHEQGFNPSKALNMGVTMARYDNVIITSPEVKPTTPVLEQFSALLGQNILCQVFDQDVNGNLTSLVHAGYRDKDPGMYFLAMFQKCGIETINGWDEEFMKGYAYEDNDFGERWVRAGLPYSLHEEIQATHLYHPRAETIPGGIQTNLAHYRHNQQQGVVRPVHGLVELS